jgi:hypothetical protein
MKFVHFGSGKDVVGLENSIGTMHAPFGADPLFEATSSAPISPRPSPMGGARRSSGFEMKNLTAHEELKVLKY